MGDRVRAGLNLTGRVARLRTEQVATVDGRVVERQVRPDERRELRVVEVVSVAPVMVEVDGRPQRVFKRLRSVDAKALSVGSWLLVCRVEQGVVVLGEVI